MTISITGIILIQGKFLSLSGIIQVNTKHPNTSFQALLTPVFMITRWFTLKSQIPNPPSSAGFQIYSYSPGLGFICCDKTP